MGSSPIMPICDIRIKEREDKTMPMVDMAATGKNIRDMRVKHHMTIKDIQNACGITATAICKWQNGQSIPTVDNLVVLAAIWNVKFDDIVVVHA